MYRFGPNNRARADDVIEQTRPDVRKSEIRTFVDVGRVGFLPCLVALLLVASGCRGLLASLLLLSRCFSASRCLSACGGLLFSSLRRHFGWI